MQPHPQQAVLQRAREGDAQAQGVLLESLRPYLRCITRALHTGRLQARLGESDLLQEIFLEAHRVFASFKGATVPELVAWVRRIAVRTAGHLLRDHTAAKRALSREQADVALESLMETSSSPSAEAIRHEQAAKMAECLARLPEDMQQVLLGRHMELEPYAVLAEQLGKSEGAVRVLHFRALERLRELFGQE
jgi:RNA polymerase sigma-70 factor (ECF subfamily)